MHVFHVFQEEWVHPERKVDWPCWFTISAKELVDRMVIQRKTRAFQKALSTSKNS